MNRRTIIHLFSAAFCGAALLFTAACGDGGTTTGPAQKAPVVLNRGTAAEPVSLDPHFTTAINEDTIVGDMLMGLTTQDAHGRPIPGAATSWETSADGLTWTFHLRDHQWSDGQPVTAGDFVYAWQRIEDPKTAAMYAGLLYVFKNAAAINSGKIAPDQLGVRAIDDKTLELKLENPAPYLPNLVMHMTTFPLPRHVIEAKGTDWTKPGSYVGNGPFLLSEWVPNDHITLVKNPKFYDAANVKLDQVIYYPVPDPDAALKRFRAGELDTLDNPPPSQIDFMQTSMADMLHKEPFLANGWMIINLQHRPYNDARVRQALNLAYDRETIANQVVRIGQPPAYSIVPPGIANYPSGIEFQFKNTPFADRLTQAQALMRAAGYGPNRRLKTNLATTPGSDARRIAAAVQEMLKKIYVDAEIVQSDAGVYVQNLRTGSFDLAAYGWVADFDDARNFLYLMMSDNVMNYGHYKNPAYDALIKQSDQEQDLTKRGALLAQAETMLLNDAALIPTRYQVTLNLVQPYVKGWFTNVNDMNRTRWLSIEKAAAK